MNKFDINTIDKTSKTKISKKDVLIQKDKIDSLVSQGFNEDDVVFALRKANLDAQLALVILNEKVDKEIAKKERKEKKEKAKESKTEETKDSKEKKENEKPKYKQILYSKMFPDDKEQDWEKFDKKKKEIKEERRLKDEEEYKKMFGNETEFDWRKFRAAKRQEKKEKNCEEGKEKCKNKEKSKRFKKGKNSKSKSKDKKESKGEKKICERKRKTSEEKNQDKEKKKQEKEKVIESILLKIKNNEIDSIYYDGNNMLMVDSSIRNDCLNKKRSEGEVKLSNICFQFGKALNIPKNLLLFDRTNNIFTKESEGVFLKVSSAYPEFESSDSAFINWTGSMDAKKVLFVTSDRILIEEIQKKGASNVIRSGEFMTMASKVLGSEYEKLVKSN